MLGVQITTMNDNQREWTKTKDGLVADIVYLGFPKELGELIAKQLGSPKAMLRMQSYLHNVRPHDANEIVDEMLAIQSDIDRWKDKKASLEANARYNDWLNSDR